MRLARIALQHWLTHSSLTLDFAPMTIVAGPNASGKSAIADAIAFALANELRRVTAKGDRNQLLTNGAESGHVTLGCENPLDPQHKRLLITREIATGKLRRPVDLPWTPETVTEALPFVIDTARFADAAPDERRKLLRQIMRADLGPTAVLAALRARGYPEDLLRQLGTGGKIEDWIAHADRGAVEARGAWKAITNEPYGTEKAEGFVVEGPEDAASDRAVQRLQDAVRVLQDDAGLLNRELGTIDAAEARHANQATRLATMSRIAASADAASAALAAADQRRTAAAAARDLAAKVARDVEGRADTARLHCPECDAALDLQGHVLVLHTAPANPSTVKERAEAAHGLDMAETALRTAETLQTQARRDFEAAANAAETLRNLAATEPKPDTAARAAIERQLAVTRASIEARTRELLEARKSLAAALAAEAATQRAASYHQAVLSWLAIKAALQPNGIPGEILARVLGPFNARLRTLSVQTGWPQVSVGDDMGIRVNSRPHHLLSKSEQWRCDAMLAVAIAIQSEVAFVVLDEFDILDVPSRRPALGWLYALTQQDELDTVLVLGTMREPPTAPANVTVHWLGESRALLPGAGPPEA